MIPVLIVLAAFLILVAVVLVRAFLFKPAPLPQPAPMTEKPDADKVIDHLQQLIRCRTVSNLDRSLEDDDAFEALYDLLPKLYPNVYRTCECVCPNDRSLIYVWKGRSSEKPVVLMAHYDVVPVRQEEWQHDAFSAQIIDGEMWGRGTLDTKATFNGVLEAADNMISEGFVPANDIYMCFAGNEEIGGSGAPANVAWLKQHGVKPELVLDEGGAVVQNVFPGVSQPAAVIGIAEKGTLDLRFELETKGGHSSTPPVHSAIGMLSDAVCRVERSPFPFRITPPAERMFDSLARYSTLTYRLIFANLWLFSPVLDMICKKSGGELNALVRTTTAFTRAKGSDAYNVLPNKAWVGANMRLIPGEDAESAICRLKHIIGDERIRIERVGGRDPSPISRMDDEPWKRLSAAIRTAWPEAVVTPYLMIACSDSCRYCEISSHVYRFSAMALTKEQRGMIHGRDERIPLQTAVHTVAFYQTLIRSC